MNSISEPSVSGVEGLAENIARHLYVRDEAMNAPENIATGIEAESKALESVAS